MHRVRGYLPDLLELPDLPIPRRVTQFPVGPSESSAQPRKRQRRAAGFSRLGVGTISDFPNPRTIAREFWTRFRTFRTSQLAHANFLGRKLNFPNLTTSNRVDQGSESSISCHFQLPRCIYPRKVRFRAICTKPPAHSDTRAFSRCASVRIRKTPVCSRSRSRALAQTPALPLSRTRARTQNAGAPPTHCARALSQNEGGTGFVPRPAFLRPDISTGCLCGRTCCRLVFGCRPRLLVAAGIRLLAALPALRPIGDGPSSWSASAVPPARSLRAAY